MTRIQANLVLLFVGALWGMGFVAQSTAMETVGPLYFVTLRFGVAALATFPFALREARNATLPLAPRDWRSFTLIGLFLFGGMVAQQTGLLTTTVTNSGFLTGLYVLMVPLFGVVLFRHRPRPIVWLAAILAVVGIWFLSGGQLGAFTAGDWLTVLCAAFWAMQLILIQRFGSSSGRPVALATVQFGVCAVLGLAAALAFETFDWRGIVHALPEILFTALFSGALAFTLQAIGQRYTSASQAAIFLASEAVFAALFGILLLGERLPATGFAGCALIFTAILLVELKPEFRRRKPARR